MKSELMSLWKQLQREGFPKPKPWSEFFAKFTPPNKEDVLSRVHCNVIYYPTNYIILFGIVLAIVMLWNVTGMLSLVVCGGVGWYVITQMKYLELPKGRLVPLQEKQLAVGALSLVILFFSGALHTMCYGILAGAAVVGSHAAMRSKTIKSGFNQLKDQALNA